MSHTILAALPLLFAPDDLDGTETLADFDGGGPPLAWRSVNDDVMGGRSRGSFRIAGGVLTFAGSLDTDGGGFASIRTRPAALDLAGAEGIVVRVRGDGRRYALRLGAGEEAASYRATFRSEEGAGWQDHWLPFTAFQPTWRGRVLDRPPLDPARIDSVGFLIADGIDGPFRLEVDSIAAYPPFALERYEWKARPLLLFAPRADDERLAALLAAIRESEEDFRERDMVLVVVLAVGTSHAGRRPLTKTAAGRLRARFDVAADTFAVRLVGKDGGVKRAASEPLPLREIYARIDRMPMRRAEMARRGRSG